MQLSLPLELDQPGQGWGTGPTADLEATFKLAAGQNVHKTVNTDSIATYIRFSGPSNLTTEQSTTMRDPGTGNTQRLIQAKKQDEVQGRLLATSQPLRVMTGLKK